MYDDVTTYFTSTLSTEPALQTVDGDHGRIETRIRFIKRAQKLGFSLQDIAHLLELDEGHCNDVREQAETKLKQIEVQIKNLQSMRKALKKLITKCNSSNEDRCCPIAQSLTENSANTLVKKRCIR